MGAAGWYYAEEALSTINMVASAGLAPPQYGTFTFKTDVEVMFDPRDVRNQDKILKDKGMEMFYGKEEVGDVETKYSKSLRCLHAATCKTKCRPAILSAADLHTESYGTAAKSVIPLEDLLGYNQWEILDGKAMGKFSLHNMLEPRHRSYYLSVNSAARRAAHSEKHKLEAVHEVYATRLVKLDHMLYAPLDAVSGRIRYPEVRGLSNGFLAASFCRLIDVSNLGKTSFIGTHMDDFVPKLLAETGGSGVSIPDAVEELEVQIGLDLPSMGTTLAAQEAAVAQTRRWGRVRCDPLDSITILPGESAVPEPGLFTPQCQFAVDSANKFLAAMQLEFSKMQTASNDDAELALLCQKFWFVLCGGYQDNRPTSASWYSSSVPTAIRTMMASTALQPCLCTKSGGGDWDTSAATAVYSGTESPTCPPKLVAAGCMHMKCESNGECGWAEKTPTLSAGGYFVEAASNGWVPCTSGAPNCVYHPSCSPTITPSYVAGLSAVPATLVHSDGVWQVAVGGQASGVSCEINSMFGAGSSEHLAGYSPAALVAASGMMGMHMALLLVPPFGIAVGAVHGFNDPGFMCLTSFQAWVQKVKTSTNGYFFRATAAALTELTASKAYKWSRNPAHLVPKTQAWSALSYAAYRSATDGLAASAGALFCKGMSLKIAGTDTACLFGGTDPSYSPSLGAGAQSYLASPTSYNGMTVSGSLQSSTPSSWGAFGWAMRRIDETCMCGYKYGVDCPLFLEHIHPRTMQISYRQGASFACCALMMATNKAAALEAGIKGLALLVGKPMDDAATMTLMKLGFKDCPWYQQITKSSHFFYPCLNGDAIDPSTAITQHDYPFIPRGSASITSSVVDMAMWHTCKGCLGLLGENCAGVASCGSNSWIVSSLTPSGYDYGKDTSESLWMYQVPCAPTDPFGASMSPLNALMDPEVGKLGCDFILRELPLYSELLEDLYTGSPSVATQLQGVRSNLPSGFGPQEEYPLSHGKCMNWQLGCHFMQWFRGGAGPYIVGTATCASLEPSSANGETYFEGCRLPWHGWWAFSDLAEGDSDEVENFVEELYDKSPELYPLSYARTWKATGASAWSWSTELDFAAPLNAAGGQITAAITDFKAGKFEVIGRIMAYMSWVTGVAPTSGTGSSTEFNFIGLSYSAASGDSTLMSQRSSSVFWSFSGTTDRSYYYMEGVTLWVPHCGSDAGNFFCLQRASHCATSTVYPPGHFCSDYDVSYDGDGKYVDFFGTLSTTGSCSATGPVMMSAAAPMGLAGVGGDVLAGRHIAPGAESGSMASLGLGDLASVYCGTSIVTNVYGPALEVVQTAATKSWMFGIDRSFSNMGMWAPPIAGAPPALAYRYTGLSGSCTPQLGHPASGSACADINPYPVDSALGCLGDFDIMVAHEDVNDIDTDGGVHMLCGYAFPCIFMEEFACSVANREFVEVSDRALGHGYGVAQKSAALHWGVYQWSPLEILGAGVSSGLKSDTWKLNFAEQPMHRLLQSSENQPAKGIAGYSTYGTRTCFLDFDASAPVAYSTGQSLYTYTETLNFALRMSLYATCLGAQLEGCDAYSPPLWFVCKTTKLTTGDCGAACQASASLTSSSWSNTPPFFSFLSGGSGNFARHAEECSMDTYSSSSQVCTCMSGSAAISGGNPPFEVLQPSSASTQHLGWIVDRLDGVIDDSFSIETAYAGPVQHDGGGAGLFLAPYTRVLGAGLMRPMASSTSLASYETAAGTRTVPTFNGRSAWSPATGGEGTQAVVASLKPVTILVADSGAVPSHSENALGTMWPWVEIDVLSGVSTFCWGTQAINPLFKMPSPDGGTYEHATGIDTAIRLDGQTGDGTTDSSSSCDDVFDDVELGKFSEPWPYVDGGPKGDACTRFPAAGELYTEECEALDEGIWVPFKRTPADQEMSQGSTYLRTLSSSAHYKLAPSRFGHLQDGVSAVCDGNDDAYRYLGVWNSESWGRVSGSADPVSNFYDSCSGIEALLTQTKPVCIDTEPLQQYKRSTTQQLISFAATDMYAPWSYDSRNGKMCRISETGLPTCYTNDPRACLITTIAQVDYEPDVLVGSGMRPLIHKMTPIAARRNLILKAGVGSMSETAMLGEGYLCKCHTPADSVFHPPWKMVEFGQIFSEAEPNWGYWGAQGRGSNSPFPEHCPCAADFCGHGAAVNGAISGRYMGVAMDVETWAIKTGDNGCMNHWFSFAMLYYMAGYSYRMPSIVTASIYCDARSKTKKDVIAEAVLYSSWQMGLPGLAAAVNNALNACMMVPQNMSPMVTTVGGTSIKLSSKKMPAFSFTGTQSWDSIATGSGEDKIIQDIVAWFSNDGPCVDIYAPADGAWVPSVNMMVDPFGRDWGYSLMTRGAGTSYSAPRVAALTAMIIQAHLELGTPVYANLYSAIPHCTAFFSGSGYGMYHYQQNFLAANTCGGNRPSSSPTLLPDPAGCAGGEGASTPYYYPSDVCVFGFWHNDGLSCSGCGSHTYTPLTWVSSTVTKAADAVPNKAWRPMFVTTLRNANIENPIAYSDEAPYHLLFLNTLLTKTLLEVKSEVSQTTAMTSWYKPYGGIKEVFASPCGGGVASTDYMPGFIGTGGTPRLCCPVCTTVATSGVAAGGNSNRCRWPAPSMFSTVGATATGKPAFYLMLLAQQAYLIAKARKEMDDKIKIAKKGADATEDVILTFSSSRRPKKVTVPKEVGSPSDSALIGFLKTEYTTVADQTITVSGSDLYEGSPGWTLGKFDTYISTNMQPYKFGASEVTPSPASSAELLFQVGCSSTTYTAMLPYCVFGSGLYSFGTATSSLYAGSPSGDKADCLYQHYAFWKTLLSCVFQGIHSLMSADSGCMSTDHSAARYGCLCRRRFKYVKLAAIQKPKVAGKTTDEVMTAAVEGKLGETVNSTKAGSGYGYYSYSYYEYSGSNV
jgi:hypothetical protein